MALRRKLTSTWEVLSRNSKEGAPVDSFHPSAGASYLTDRQVRCLLVATSSTLVLLSPWQGAPTFLFSLHYVHKPCQRQPTWSSVYFPIKGVLLPCLGAGAKHCHAYCRTLNTDVVAVGKSETQTISSLSSLWGPCSTCTPFPDSELMIGTGTNPPRLMITISPYSWAIPPKLLQDGCLPNTLPRPGSALPGRELCIRHMHSRLAVDQAP